MMSTRVLAKKRATSDSAADRDASTAKPAKRAKLVPSSRLGPGRMERGASHTRREPPLPVTRCQGNLTSVSERHFLAVAEAMRFLIARTDGLVMQGELIQRCKAACASRGALNDLTELDQAKLSALVGSIVDAANPKHVMAAAVDSVAVASQLPVISVAAAQHEAAAGAGAVLQRFRLAAADPFAVGQAWETTLLGVAKVICGSVAVWIASELVVAPNALCRTKRALRLSAKLLFETTGSAAKPTSWHG